MPNRLLPMLLINWVVEAKSEHLILKIRNKQTVNSACFFFAITRIRLGDYKRMGNGDRVEGHRISS